jgi:plastocyanin
MKRSNWILCIAAVMLLALVAFPALDRKVAAATPTAEVTIDNFTFSPATLTVKAGTQVTWTNHDDMPHTVTSEDQTFKSKALDTDEKFSFTPSKPGTYTYYCSIHPKMTGKLVVE